MKSAGKARSNGLYRHIRTSKEIIRNLLNYCKKNEKWFRFAALSFTALTVCSFYSDGAMRVLNEDWGGLMDIMPTMSKALWVCVGISILLNSVSLFREK